MDAAQSSSLMNRYWRPSAALQVAQTTPLAARLVAAICAFALIIGIAATAPTAAATNPETAVAAQTTLTHTSVGAEQPVSTMFIGPNSGYAYDAVSGFCVAPNGLVDDLPNSGPIALSLGAESRSEQLPRKLNLNVNSPTTRQVLNSLDTDVSSFVGEFRRGGIWWELPGEVAGMSVEEATQHSSTVRKLLVDNRFVK